jgi:F-type H+-transporting ATPase subunit b
MPQLEISTFLPQIFWLVVTFSALYIVMWRFAVPSIADVLESRQKRIEDNLEKAAKAKQEAEKTFLSYEVSIQKARAKAQNIHVSFAKKLSEEIEASEIKATIEFSKKITENEMEIQATIDKIVKNTQKSAIEVAVEAINRLTGQLPDEKEINSAIERALKIQN